MERDAIRVGEDAKKAEKIVQKNVKAAKNLLKKAEKRLKKKWDVKAAAGGGVVVAAAAAEEEKEEQTEFDVVLKSFGAKKINVIKAVREITALGLKEAKELVEGAPSAVKEGVEKEEADDLAETTFREATRDIGAYQDRGDGSFLRWLARILQNKIRDRAEFYAAGKRDISRERSADDAGGEEGGRRLELPSEDLSVTRFVRRSDGFLKLPTRGVCCRQGVERFRRLVARQRTSN